MRNNVIRVRVLKKVRIQYLHKTPDENEQQGYVPEVLDPAAHHLVNNDGYALKASVGLITAGRKIFVEPQFMSAYFNIESAVIENQLQNKAVALNLCPNENKVHIPWEYSVKRLESYGDLELATWANRVRKHYSLYSQTMSNYFDMINSNDPEITTALEKIKTKVTLARKEIESKHIFNRFVQLMKKDADQPLSCCYSEGLLKAIGYTPESFISWSKENGIPKVFQTGNDMYGDIIKNFLQYIPAVSNPIQEGPMTENVIYHKEGFKCKVKTRVVSIVEPTLEGTLLYTYLVLDDIKVSERKELTFEDEEEVDISNFKKKMATGGSECSEKLEKFVIDNKLLL